MLNDSVLFITGAGKGIGEAVVQNLISRRAEFPNLKLFLTARTLADLKRLQNEALSAGVPCHHLAADLSEAPRLAFEACLQTYGRIDGFIHCAGVGRFGDFLDLTLDDLQFVMKSNVEASFLLMQSVYRRMKSQTAAHSLRGQIQWVTSVAAETPFPQSSLYCMSKFAQQGLIEVMRGYARQDLIRILEVQPGATLTPMWGEVTSEMKAKMMLPIDIALPMVDALLASPRSTTELLKIRPLAGDL